MKSKLENPKPDPLLKITRKRWKEYLPMLTQLRRAHPHCYDHDLLAYMFLMMKDKVFRKIGKLGKLK